MVAMAGAATLLPVPPAAGVTASVLMFGALSRMTALGGIWGGGQAVMRDTDAALKYDPLPIPSKPGLKELRTHSTAAIVRITGFRITTIIFA
jgi:hypothetical protein